MIRLTVKWNDKDLKAWCDSSASALRNWAQGEIQAGPAMLRALEDYHAEVFRSGGQGSAYGPWASLKTSTLLARLRRRKTSKIAPFDYAAATSGGVGILRWSGRLYRSLATQGTRYGDAIRKTSSTGIVFGTSCPTALFHAAGRGGRNPMAARKPLDDLRGPNVALVVAAGRIMSYLTSDSQPGSKSPGVVRNAAGFYAKR